MKNYENRKSDSFKKDIFPKNAESIINSLNENIILISEPKNRLNETLYLVDDLFMI